MVRSPCRRLSAFTLAELLVALVIIAIVIGLFLYFSGAGETIESWWADRERASQEEEARKQQAKQIEQERARQAAAESELEGELRKFAKEFVPDLQQAIDKYREQIKLFTEQSATFAQEMARLRVDPNTRPAYGHKGQIIEKMKADREQLLVDRKETYIRWKELSLLRDSADTREQRERLLQNAQKAARSAEDTFQKYMNQSRDADGK